LVKKRKKKEKNTYPPTFFWPCSLNQDYFFVWPNKQILLTISVFHLFLYLQRNLHFFENGQMVIMFLPQTSYISNSTPMTMLALIVDNAKNAASSRPRVLYE